MPLTENPKHIYEPNSLACGQAVISMLTDTPVEEIIKIVGTEKETNLKQMFSLLEHFGIEYDKTRHEAQDKEGLPQICILSLETPKCWHWSLYFKGKFYDPEYGVIGDFPNCNRKYYFTIKSEC